MVRIVIIFGSILATGLVFFTSLLLFQPEWLFSKLRQHSPEVIYAIDTQTSVVALTIDDGPDQITTSRLLDILKKHDARATFFLITDRIAGNEAIVHQIVAEGHDLGNHMPSDEPSIQLDPIEFETQLTDSNRILTQFGDASWFRPGSGWYNKEMLTTVHQQGYRLVLGSIYPYDPQLGSTWFSIRYILWKIKPGSIIILHDFGTRGERTADILENILPVLGARGFQVVTLSELIALGEPTR